MSVDQLLSMRPSPTLSGYRTPVEGLFLTGAGTHPGGGITGAPGRNAAGVVLAELGMRRTAPRRAVAGAGGDAARRAACGARPAGELTRRLPNRPAKERR